MKVTENDLVAISQKLDAAVANHTPKADRRLKVTSHQNALHFLPLKSLETRMPIGLGELFVCIKIRRRPAPPPGRRATLTAALSPALCLFTAFPHTTNSRLHQVPRHGQALKWFGQPCLRKAQGPEP